MRPIAQVLWAATAPIPNLKRLLIKRQRRGFYRMNWIKELLWHNEMFLGIVWTPWKVVGWVGNLVFFSRFIVQWYATEKLKRVVVPAAFWWLSLTGAMLLFSYALFYQKDSVFIFAYAFTWIPYIRNLVIHKRHSEAHVTCPSCGASCAPHSNYCAACGNPLHTLAPSPAPS